MRLLRQDIRLGLPSLVLGLATILYGSSSSLGADLIEDFDDGTTDTPLTLEAFNSDPGALFGVQEVGGNPGGYLQITTDGVNDNRNYAYFDRTAEGGYETINFSFDLLIGPQEASADGGSIAFLDTNIFGDTGGVATSVFAVPEDPSQIGVLGIGFDTWSNTDVGDLGPVPGQSNSAYNDVTLYYDAARVDQFVNPDASMRDVLPNGVRIDDNTWHTVAGSFDFINQTASMTINGLDVWNDLPVPGLEPFESRVMFGARTGGENENFFVDNVAIEYVGPTEIEEPEPVGPQPEPTEGNWSVREWNVFVPLVTDIGVADAIIANPDLQTTTFVSDGMRSMINLNDPDAGGGGYTIPNAGPLAKQPIVSDLEGTDDNDVVMRARAKVIIPSDGQYTFGFDGDDGARLTIPGADFTLQHTDETGTASGESIEFSAPTGNALTLASTFLPAGEHDIELVWFERAGGAFVEVFASPGVDDEVNLGADGFAPIGLTEEVVLAQGTLPTTVGEWNVRTVDVVSTRQSSAVDDMGNPLMGLNNLEDAQAAIDLDDLDPDVEIALDLPNLPLVNFNDPDTNGTGSGRFTPDDPFPLEETGVDDNDFAILATTTVSIAEENDYIFGFASDDGASLTLEGAEFTILNPGDPREVTNDGQTMEFNANTGNSNTFGWTHLLPGEYELEFLMWERGGGAFAEVFTGVGDTLLEFLTTARLLGSPAETFDLVVPVGLQLAGEAGPGPGVEGDFNNNGLVEQQDLDLVLGNWGESAANVPANWTNDLPEGNIDQTELDKVLANWGNTAALGNGASVPEPSSLALLLIVAGLGLGLWRKHR